MKNWWKILILSLIAGCGTFSYSDAASSAGAALSLDQTETVYVFTLPTPDLHVPCEPAVNTVNIAPDNLPGSISVKDFYRYEDDQLTENLKKEREIRSYLYYTDTFSASEDLLLLRRLNI